MYRINNYLLTKSFSIILAVLVINLGIISCKKDEQDNPENKTELDENAYATVKTNNNGEATIITNNYGEVIFEIADTDNKRLENITINYSEDDSLAFVEIYSETGEYQRVIIYGDISKMSIASATASGIVNIKSTAVGTLIVAVILFAASAFALIYNSTSAVNAFNEINEFWISDEVIDEFENKKLVKTAPEIIDYIKNNIDLGGSIASCLITIATFGTVGPVASAIKTPALQATNGILAAASGPATDFLMDWIFEYNKEEWENINEETRFWVSTNKTRPIYVRGVLIENYGIDLSLYDGTSATVETDEVTSITSNSAICGGSISDAGGLFIEDKGICWNTTVDPTIEDCLGYTSEETGSESFSSELMNLVPDTKYYVRAYAVNYEGISYGNNVSFYTRASSVHASGILTDLRDGQSYNTVQIGDQWWMSENLNFQTDSSWCYNEDEDMCMNYGRLYHLNDALDACPSGWHLPTEEEWFQLFFSLGLEHEDSIYTSQELVQKLVVGGSSGLDIQLGGYRSPLDTLIIDTDIIDFNQGRYSWKGVYGTYWTSSITYESDIEYYMQATSLWFLYILGNGMILEMPAINNMGFSVRCVKD